MPCSQVLAFPLITLCLSYQCKPPLLAMNVEEFILDTPVLEGQLAGMKMSSKRYTYTGNHAQEGLTILACHGLGQHKEQWEPFLEDLFALQAQQPSRLRIREVWAFDWQNHGESYVLNKDLIKDDVNAAPLVLWGAALAAFIRSGRVGNHGIVALGYSAGCVGLLLASKYLAPAQPFQGMILIDPAMMDADTWHTNRQKLQATFDFAKRGAISRRDSWLTRAEAAKYLKDKFPYNMWNERVLQRYVEHALYETTNSSGKLHVQRKCPGIQEASFRANLTHTWAAMEQADVLQHVLPIHLVLGTGDGVMPEVIRECVADQAKGRRYTSVSYVHDVGHMIIQSDPKALAVMLFSLLERISLTAGTARL
ncbi:alpha/beta-hydrolase [Trametopsis cervina]|nr:alpha/beta-hydrolase [Trametopsis cervina]